jgi:hypothetical protein
MIIHEKDEMISSLIVLFDSWSNVSNWNLWETKLKLFISKMIWECKKRGFWSVSWVTRSLWKEKWDIRVPLKKHKLYFCYAVVRHI